MEKVRRARVRVLNGNNIVADGQVVQGSPFGFGRQLR